MIGYSLHSAGKTEHVQKDATDLFYRNLKQRPPSPPSIPIVCGTTADKVIFSSVYVTFWFETSVLKVLFLFMQLALLACLNGEPFISPHVCKPHLI